MSRTRKFTGWTRNERTIAAGATNQFNPLIYTCEDQGGETIVSVHVEIALGAEPGTTESASNLAGYARLVINRAGNVIPQLGTTGDWDATTTPDTINDEDAGDTWAITPWALGGIVVAGVIFADSASGAGPIHLTLSPKTKRSLRKGDTLEVEIQYSNGGGTGNGIAQEAVTGTVFVQGD